VYVRNKSPLTYLKFRTALYTSLLGSSLNVKIYQLKLKLDKKRTFKNNQAHLYQVSKKKWLGTYVQYSYFIQLQRL
jgi:hypothetical protein